MKKILSKRNYSKEVIDSMKPKDTKKHPWRKSNDALKNYSRKALAERKKNKL
jgi:hypothetical protein